MEHQRKSTRKTFITGLLSLIIIIPFSYATYPGKLFREYWGNQQMGFHLINMTQLLCKDAMYKLRMADLIQEDYKYALGYELGLLASGIMDKFKHMLQIYRFYSDIDNFKRRRADLEPIMNAYHIMQSDYNEIRTDRDLFNEVVKRHAAKKSGKKRNPKLSNLDLTSLKDSKHKGKQGRRSNDVQNITEIQQENTTDLDISVNILPLHMKNDTQRLNILEPKQRVVNKTVWNKYNNPEEDEYKKKLRYSMWADRWKGFNPEIEGVHIPEKIAKVGLNNASNFLVKELKGVI